MSWLQILQGSDDHVVPPVQAKDMVNAVEGDLEYRQYKGEAHGWKKSSTIKNSIEIELEWYKTVFNL
jgi:dipeptidyl aminopeptidase/acylaminoacyl peptidase